MWGILLMGLLDDLFILHFLQQQDFSTFAITDALGVMTTF